ncbi:MAG: Gfo/Idh/MocA family oxidoreductase [Burkholderiales bacterium]|nr:Gfo/Idh/MocA family oxidoreductase [Anaerolineae bacterium]
MASRKIGVGVIGMGWMGQVHSRSYQMISQRFPDAGLSARLVICSDNVQERAEKTADMLGFGQWTTDWHEVIAHPDVEVVNIATPNNLHVEIVKAAAAVGKHIFCEKPVGRTPEETAEIEAIARSAGVLAFVGFNYRWAPLVRHAKKLIDGGKLGDLTQFRGRFFSMYGSNPYGLLSWRFDEASAGYGVLGDIMSHATDMALMLAGPIKRLVSNQHTFIPERPKPIPGTGTHYSVGRAGDPTYPVTNEDYIGALVEFENGIRGTLEVSRTIFGPKNEFAFELNGTKGALAWNFERMNELQVYAPTPDGEHDGFIRLVGGDQYPDHGNFNPGEGSGLGYEDLKVIEAYNWLKSVADGQQTQPGFTEALAVANVHAAMVRSWDSGQWEDVTSLRK